jgi:hypothetical protein
MTLTAGLTRAYGKHILRVGDDEIAKLIIEGQAVYREYAPAIVVGFDGGNSRACCKGK